MINVRKNITNDHDNVRMIMQSQVRFNIFIRILSNERNEGYARNVFQTFIMKCLINSKHKMFKQHCRSHVLETFYQKRFLNPYFQNAY